jgi:hypothetical protein
MSTGKTIKQDQLRQDSIEQANGGTAMAGLGSDPGQAEGRAQHRRARTLKQKILF